MKPSENIRQHIENETGHTCSIDQWPDVSEVIKVQELGSTGAEYPVGRTTAIISIVARSKSGQTALAMATDVYDLYKNLKAHNVTLPAPDYAGGQTMYLNKIAPASRPAPLTFSGDSHSYAFNLELIFTDP